MRLNWDVARRCVRADAADVQHSREQGFLCAPLTLAAPPVTPQLRDMLNSGFRR